MQLQHYMWPAPVSTQLYNKIYDDLNEMRIGTYRLVCRQVDLAQHQTMYIQRQVRYRCTSRVHLTSRLRELTTAAKSFSWYSIIGPEGYLKREITLCSRTPLSLYSFLGGIWKCEMFTINPHNAPTPWYPSSQAMTAL